MTNKIIQQLEAEQMGKEIPAFAPGDTVIVPSFTFAATANAVALTGALYINGQLADKTTPRDNSRAADSPTSGMPTAKSQRLSGIVRARSRISP